MLTEIIKIHRTVIKNAKTLSEEMLDKGYNLVTWTDNPKLMTYKIKY
jgi:glycine/serine hydroxymethyltransferase